MGIQILKGAEDHQAEVSTALTNTRQANELNVREQAKLAAELLANQNTIQRLKRKHEPIDPKHRDEGRRLQLAIDQLSDEIRRDVPVIRQLEAELRLANNELMTAELEDDRVVRRKFIGRVFLPLWIQLLQVYADFQKLGRHAAQGMETSEIAVLMRLVATCANIYLPAEPNSETEKAAPKSDMILIAFDYGWSGETGPYTRASFNRGDMAGFSPLYAGPPLAAMTDLSPDGDRLAQPAHVARLVNETDRARVVVPGQTKPQGAVALLLDAGFRAVSSVADVFTREDK
jgi:hypothetical protein